MGDGVRAEARRLLAAGVSGQAFPGAVACVAVRGASGVTMVEACAGTLEKAGARVHEGSRYDLSALTQPFVAVAALRLAERGEIDLDAEIEAILPDTRGGVLSGVKLRELFLHRSGLAAWGGLYLDVPHEAGSAAARRWIVSEASRRGDRPRGTMVESDLGYIIAGEALARLAGISLDALLVREVFAPLGLGAEVEFPGALPTERRSAAANDSAPTERCEWRGYVVRGEVHDENASALGGIAGHAGLFATARGVARFGVAMLDALQGQGDFLSRATIERALADVGDGGALRFGWAQKDGEKACGRRMSASTFGRVGMTGTSLFCDPEQGVAIALLTNRISPSRANEKIDGFRPAFHDGVLGALTE